MFDLLNQDNVIDEGNYLDALTIQTQTDIDLENDFQINQNNN